jgi:hypothetical protein
VCPANPRLLVILRRIDPKEGPVFSEIIYRDQINLLVTWAIDSEGINFPL